MGGCLAKNDLRIGSTIDFKIYFTTLQLPKFVYMFHENVTLVLMNYALKIEDR